MEIIRIRVQMNGEKTALSSLSAIDAKISEINKKQVNVNINTRDTQNATDQVKNLGTAAGNTAKQSKILGDTLSMIKFTAIAAAIGGVTVAFKNALSEMKAVDTELTNIQKVSNKTQAEIQKLGDSAYSTASKYGVAADEYLSAVYTFQKAGLGDSAEQLGELATKTMLVGDTSADVASKFLIAVDAAWGLKGSMSALSTVVDEADYINNNYATSLDKLSAGMPIVASTAANLGMSIEETLAVLGTITSKTQETGTKAATAWRALAMNITGELGTITDETGETIEVTEQSVKSISDALKIYGNESVKAAQQSGKIINPMEAVISLAEAYKDGLLTDIELENILINVGGKLRTNQLTALVKDLASETSTYYDIMSKLPNAAGTADAEINVMLSSWDSKTKILANTWTEFVQKTVNSDSIKGLLDTLTLVIDGMDNLGIAAENVGGILLMAFSGKIATGIAETVSNVKKMTEALKGAETGAGALQGALFGIGAAITVITAVTMALRQLRENAVEAASEQSSQHAENAASYKEEGEKLYELVKKYRELARDGVSKNELSQVQSIQEAINELLGDQFTAVDLVNGAYKEQIGYLVDVQSEIQNATREELDLAAKMAETALIASTRGLLGENKGGSVSSTGVDKSIFSGLSSFVFEDGFDSFSGSDLGQIKFTWGKTGAEIVSTYDDISEAIHRMSNEYSASELAGNDVWLWLNKNLSSAKDAVETYRAAMEAANGDPEKEAAANDALADSLGSIVGSADEAAAAINNVVSAKQKLDNALAAPARDEAFTSIADVYKDFTEEVEAGRVNSNAFWKDAEFLLGPEVLAQYGDNYQAVIDAINNSHLEEVFAGANGDARDFIDALNAAADAEGSVADGAARVTQENGKTHVTVNDVEALADAWGMTEDEIFAALQALEDFGAFEFEGDTLLDFLDYLNLGLGEASQYDFTSLVTSLSNLGYSDNYIKNVVDHLRQMGMIDLGGAKGGIEDITALTHGADEAAQQFNSTLDQTNGKTMSNVSGQVQGVGSQLTTANDKALKFASSLDKLNGKKVTSTITTRNVVENYTYNNTVMTTTTNTGTGTTALQNAWSSRYATGTTNASGGPALVGDEHSPDGSPRPELIVDNGNSYVAGTLGPEIVRLNPGAQVFTAAETRRIMSGNIPAYASGTILCYLYYNANGGSGAPSTRSCIKGNTITVSSVRPTRSGYTFNGWAQNAGASQGWYWGGTSLKMTTNRTLYAIWKKNATVSTYQSQTASKASTTGYKNTVMTTNSNQSVANTTKSSGASGTVSYTTSTSSSSGGGGSSYSSGGGGGGSYSSGSSSSSSGATTDPKDTYMQKVDDLTQYWEYLIWKRNKDGTWGNTQTITFYGKMMDKIQQYIKHYQDLGEDEHSEYIQKLTRKWWEYADAVADVQEDVEDELTAAMEKRLAEAEKVKDAQIAAIRERAQAEEDANKLEEKKLALLEAQQKLLNAQSERTVRIYNAQTGQWEWVADAANVKSAQDALVKAQKALNEEANEQARDAQIAAIEKKYESLETAWEKIADSLEDPDRALSKIVNELKKSGTPEQAAAAKSAWSLSKTITSAITNMESLGTVSAVNKKAVMYGASPNGTGSVATVSKGAAASGTGNAYYINGVEISAAKAQSMTIADLAKSLSALTVYNNS